MLAQGPDCAMTPLRSRIPLALKARWHRWRLRHDLPAWLPDQTGLVCAPFVPGQNPLDGTAGLWRETQYVVASGIWRYGHLAVGQGPAPLAVQHCLHGRSFYLGPVLPHYGHCLTETLSRWWPLTPSNLSTYDWFVTPTPAHQIPAYAWELLDIAGIRERVYCCEAATALEQVSVAAPAMTLQETVHTAVRHLSQLFASTPAPAAESSPLFISRRHIGLDGQARAVLGEEWIEQALRDSGCTVIEPQTLSVHEQIQAFRRHQTIIGFAGSALHTSMLAGGGQRVLAYTDRNVPPHFHMLDRALRIRSRYLACGVRPNKDLLDIRVGFRPQWVDPTPVLKACHENGWIPQWDDRAYRDACRSGQLTRRFNALLLLRHVQELAAGRPEQAAVALDTWADHPQVDRETLNTGLQQAPQLSAWLQWTP